MKLDHQLCSAGGFHAPLAGPLWSNSGHKEGHERLIIASPFPTFPRAVSQAERTTRSAFKSSFMISEVKHPVFVEVSLE